MPLHAQRPEHVDRLAAEMLDDLERHGVPLRADCAAASGRELESIVVRLRLFDLVGLLGGAPCAK